MITKVMLPFEITFLTTFFFNSLYLYPKILSTFIVIPAVPIQLKSMSSFFKG